MRTTIRGAHERIRYRIPFKAGKMDSKMGTFFGVRYVQEHAYTVYSYRWTFPLAVWIDGWGWFTHTHKYSRTTSRHQSVTERAIGSNATVIKFDTLVMMADIVTLSRDLEDLRSVPLKLAIMR